MFEALTHSIRVRVTPKYAEEHSTPEDAEFYWTYTVEIANEGRDAVQLKTRHWRITDGDGQVTEVRGPGVVGQTPVIMPGKSFTYTSGCPLKTPQGIMAGSYQMTDAAGSPFDVAIPAFSLDSPFAVRRAN